MYLLKNLKAFVPLLFVLSLVSASTTSQDAAASATVAAADPKNTNADSPAPTFNNKTTDTLLCHGTSWVRQTSETSPLVTDCLHLCANIEGGGTWTVENVRGSFHQIAEFGTCAFGVQSGNLHSGSSLFYVGNEDIIVAIEWAVKAYAVGGLDGKVGAGGSMLCPGTILTGDMAVWFDIYHT
jgi:hypothetical protein